MKVLLKWKNSAITTIFAGVIILVSRSGLPSPMQIKLNQRIYLARSRLLNWIKNS